jgi:hypothetical protein
MVCFAGCGTRPELLEGLQGLKVRMMWLCCMELWLEIRKVSGIRRKNRESGSK